jgi:hypothetical protein
MMVNGGPQLVQLVNGYRNRRSEGSASSRRQSAQVAVSAAISVRRWPPGSLATIPNDGTPMGGMGDTVIRSTRASGGPSRSGTERNSRTASGEPSTLTGVRTGGVRGSDGVTAPPCDRTGR